LSNKDNGYYKANVFLLHFFVCWRWILTVPKYEKEKSGNGFFDLEMSQVTFGTFATRRLFKFLAPKK
jgi:hypothetical protein